MVAALTLTACNYMTPPTSDGGANPQGGGAGGTLGGGTGSNTVPEEEESELPLPVVVPAEYFDAGAPTNDDKRMGCAAPALAPGTPECSPATSGCKQPGDCPAGLCLKTATGGVCTTDCRASADCLNDWHCEARWTGAGREGFCLPNGGLR